MKKDVQAEMKSCVYWKWIYQGNFVGRGTFLSSVQNFQRIFSKQGGHLK